MTSHLSAPLHVVLGAGGAIVQGLVERQLAVRAVTRGSNHVFPHAVEHVAADLADGEDARRAVAGGSVVYHAANPPCQLWVDEYPPLNRHVLAATRDAGTRLVFADNLYMYGLDAGVMTEDSALRASDKKGRLRIELARELMEADARGDVPVAIGRSSDYFGPGGFNTSLGGRLFGAALAGKGVPWLGSADQPHSVAFLPDMARSLVTLGQSDEALPVGSTLRQQRCQVPGRLRPAAGDGVGTGRQHDRRLVQGGWCG